MKALSLVFLLGAACSSSREPVKEPSSPESHDSDTSTADDSGTIAQDPPDTSSPDTSPPDTSVPDTAVSDSGSPRDTGDTGAEPVDLDGDGFSVLEGDCDDGDASVSPDADELCDRMDNDCDGEVDEGDALDALTWFRDDDSDSYGDWETATTACERPAGFVENGLDCDDDDNDIHPAASEVCDMEDHNCDGDPLLDAVDMETWFADSDGDGAGDPSVPVVACWITEDESAYPTDCDDSDPLRYPGADEFCNGLDDDCDGVVDEEDAVDASTWYADWDGDGYGDPGAPALGCTAPSEHTTDTSDCDDDDNDIHPGAVEICDGEDNDCDGMVDGLGALDALTHYADADLDGFGDSSTAAVSCEVPAGRVLNSSDCDDGHAEARPGGTEVCDGLDNDCDGTTDGAEAIDALAHYADVDGDSFGDPESLSIGCDVPADRVLDASDCDDAHAEAYPGGTEVCDDLDNDCDGTTDGPDAADWTMFFFDSDGDGFGDASVGMLGCEPLSGFVTIDADCDDSSSAVHPDAVDVCNGLDDNCDGAVDEGGDSSCEGDDVCVEGECRPPCSNGQWDESFADGGILRFDRGGDDWLNSLDVDGDGRIVGAYNSGSGNFEVFRAQPEGTLDDTFGSGGFVSTAVGPSARASVVRFDPAGRLVVAGTTSMSCSFDHNRYALTRHSEDGSLDLSFGSAGITTTDFDAVGSSVYGLGFQSGGQIVLSGSRYQGGCSPGINLSTVTRYDVNGNLDTSFGSGPFAGETRLDIPVGPHHDGNMAIAIGADDRIYTTAREHYGSWAGVQLYGASGAFSTRVMVSDQYAGGIIADDDGTFVVSTSTNVVRMASDGSLVAGFGSGGRVTGLGTIRALAENMVIDDEGRIVLIMQEDDRFKLVRLLSSGELDLSFGEGGYSELALSGSSFQRATVLRIDAEGDILVGGVVTTDGTRDVVVARVCQ